MSEELHDSVVRNSLQSVEFSVDTLTLGEPRIDDLEGCLPVTLSDSEGAGESARAEVGYLIREGKEGMATRSSSVRSAGKFFPYIVRGDEFSNLQVV